MDGNTQKKTKKMDINYALNALNQGLLVHRTCWNRFGLYLKMVLKENEEFCWLYDKEGACMRWSWSCEDLKANDWEVFLL